MIEYFGRLNEANCMSNVIKYNFDIEYTIDYIVFADWKICPKFIVQFFVVIPRTSLIL